MVIFFICSAKKWKEKTIVKSKILQNHVIRNWWSGNEVSFYSFLTVCRPLLQREVNIFLNIISRYSNNLPDRLFKSNYWLIYWLIKTLLPGTLKAFDNKSNKSVWSNVLWYVKVYISWKFIQYIIPPANPDMFWYRLCSMGTQRNPPK